MNSRVQALARGRGSRCAHLWALAVMSCTLVPTFSAAAQDETSAADRDAAATAYDRGTSAFLSHDYPRAAQWFETAYRLAPNPQALIGAIRARERSGDLLRAATLALRVEAFHAGDEAATREATTTLAQATPLYVRVDVTCSAECTVELDGTVQSHTSFFVEPGAEHRIVATFETGTAESTVSGTAGERRSIGLEAPPAPVVVVDDTIPTDQPPTSGGGISPAFFVTGLVLTAGAGGVLIWSGIDTLDGVPAYEADPTPARLADGQSRELRTNVMIGVTGALAITTLVFAIVTDWDGDPATAEAAPGPDGSADGSADGADGADAPRAEPSAEVTAVSLLPMAGPTGVDGVFGSVAGRF